MDYMITPAIEAKRIVSMGALTFNNWRAFILEFDTISLYETLVDFNLMSVCVTW